MADDLSIPSPGIRSTSTTTTVRSSRYGAGQRAARPGMDPDVRRMALFAGGIGTVLAVLIGISALTGRHSGEVPVIAADGRPIRVKPVDPGGMKVAGSGENDVFSGGSDTRNARLGPAAETPDAAALRTAEVDPAPFAEAPAPAPAATPPAPAPQATPKALPAPSASGGQTVAKAPPAPALSTPAAGAQATPKVVTAPAPSPRPVPAPAPAPAPATATGHGASVQLAALTTEQAAHTEWQALVKRMPDLLASHQPIFSRTERDGRTYWRVRTSGFAEVAQARSFCEKVRAKGGGCSVTEF